MEPPEQHTTDHPAPPSAATDASEPSRLAWPSALGVVGERVKGVAGAVTTRAAVPYAEVDGQVRDELARELHVYPRKRPWLARVLWLVTGIVGGHRYYLGKTLTGVVMTMTGGGLLLWWIVDGFLLRRMVTAHNTIQSEREAAAEPPLGMEFVPVVAPDALGKLPDWHQTRPYSNAGRMARRAAGLMADAAMLAMSAFLLGALAEGAEVYNPVYAAVAVVLMINGAPLIMQAYEWPVARNLIRWDMRLRLFYHFNKPGHALRLFGRLCFGFLYAPFVKKARSEVKLYLEVAGVFVAGAALLHIVSGQAWEALTAFQFDAFFDHVVENWVRNTFVGFIMVYGFTAVIGATLMKHILLRRPRWVLWGLSGLALYFLIVGMQS